MVVERRPEPVQAHNCAALMAGVFVVVVTFSVCCVMAVVVRRWALLVLHMPHLQAAAATHLVRAESYRSSPLVPGVANAFMHLQTISLLCDGACNPDCLRNTMPLASGAGVPVRPPGLTCGL